MARVMFPKTEPAMTRSTVANRLLVERTHPDDLHETARRALRSVTLNLDESPLGWLHARKLIGDRELLAGEQLRRDYERAGLAASVTMRWDPAPIGAGGGSAGRTGATDSQIDAKARFDAALADVGPGLADICWRVICAGEGMPIAERALGWPARSGRLVLTLALDRLARFYRIG